MRNRPLIFALVAVAVVLIACVVLWSRGPSVADKTAAPENSTPVASGSTSTPPAADAGPAAQPATPGKPAMKPGGTPAVSQDGTTAVAPVPGANSLPPATPPPGDKSASGDKLHQEALIGLNKTRRMIVDYHTLMGENPVGTNAEIMKAIMGRNPRGATLGPMEGQQLNDRGELIDEWGTPYFFHQLSGNHMEIHSAGPDKIMGTKDDLVTD